MYRLLSVGQISDKILKCFLVISHYKLKIKRLIFLAYFLPLILVTTFLQAGTKNESTDWIEHRKQYYSIVAPGISNILSEGKCKNVNSLFDNYNSELNLITLAGQDELGAADIYVEALAATCNPSLAKTLSLDVNGKEKIEKYVLIRNKVSNEISSLLSQNSCASRTLSASQAYSVATLALTGKLDIDIYNEALRENCDDELSKQFARNNENGRSLKKIYNETYNDVLREMNVLVSQNHCSNPSPNFLARAVAKKKVFENANAKIFVDAYKFNCDYTDALNLSESHNDIENKLEIFKRISTSTVKILRDSCRHIITSGKTRFDLTNRDLIATNLIANNKMDEIMYLNNLKLTCDYSRAIKLTNEELETVAIDDSSLDKSIKSASEVTPVAQQNSAASK